jgi:hypothetical protein
MERNHESIRVIMRKVSTQKQLVYRPFDYST